MKLIGFIYLTTCIVNGKIYVGKHEFSSKQKNYIGSGTLFKRAFKKYGKENFKRKVLRLCYSLHELRIWEHVLIMKHKSYIREIGYNIARGDVNTSEWNPTKLLEVRKKISESMKGRYRGVYNPNFGKRWNLKQRKQLSVSLKLSYKINGHPRIGKCHSEEAKKKMSEVKKGKYIGEKSHCFGKHLSEEVKDKIRKSNSGKKHSEETKKKMSESQRGKNNAMYNSKFIWITNGVINKRGKIDELIQEGWKKGFLLKS